MTDTTINQISTVFPINTEAIKPDKKHHRRRSIIREFSLNTSTHGIPGIARSENICNRIFWTISLLFFTAVMLYFIVESVDAYFKYPTQTSVSIIVERSQPFPAVSICNFSPTRSDTFIPALINFTNSRNLTNTTNFSMITREQARYLPEFLDYLHNKNDSETISKYLFSLQSMLLSCTYNNQPCSASDFIMFISYTYGYCYTFNAKIKFNESSVRLTTDNGSFGRLQLQLYSYSEQYLPYASGDVSGGMVAMIHDNTELPLIDIAGIILATGKRHKLNYKKRIHQLLPSPYSKCTNKIPLMMRATFDRYHGADYAYSQVLCYTLCTQVYVYQECKCVNPYQWTIRSIVLPGSDQIIEAPLCKFPDPCYNSAAAQIFGTPSIWNKYCSDCSEACTTVDFVVTPSSASAPSTLTAETYKTFVENSNISLPANWSTTWQTQFEKNYVSLDVVCETTRIETYTAVESMSSIDLLSNVGGQTGLWIGISLLTIMEFIEIFYRLIRYQCYVLRNKLRKRELNLNNEYT